MSLVSRCSREQLNWMLEFMPVRSYTFLKRECWLEDFSNRQPSVLSDADQPLPSVESWIDPADQPTVKHSCVSVNSLITARVSNLIVVACPWPPCECL